ncbi:MAG: hypothetical protein QW484_01610 [Candidatus Pacearchaeota archaeon]
MIDLWGIILWGALLVIIVELIVFLLIKYYKQLRGKERKIWGELIRDLGIGLIAGAIITYRADKLEFWFLIIITAFTIFFGIAMKENIRSKK